MASSSTCQFCREEDGKLHFLTCVQANNIGAFTREALSPLFFPQGSFSWEKVGTVEISTASHNKRLADLILLSKAVNHISTTRRRDQEACPTKFSATLNYRAEVAAKKFPGTGTVLAAWAGDLLAQSLVPA